MTQTVHACKTGVHAYSTAVHACSTLAGSTASSDVCQQPDVAKRAIRIANRRAFGLAAAVRRRQSGQQQRNRAKTGRKNEALASQAGPSNSPRCRAHDQLLCQAAARWRRGRPQVRLWWLCLLQGQGAAQPLRCRKWRRLPSLHQVQLLLGRWWQPALGVLRVLGKHCC